MPATRQEHTVPGRASDRIGHRKGAKNLSSGGRRSDGAVGRRRLAGFLVGTVPAGVEFSIPDSSNGRTLRSERNNCGSNPCGVTPIIYP